MCEVILPEWNLRVLAYSVLSAISPPRDRVDSKRGGRRRLCLRVGRHKKKRKMDDEMDGRVMDDTAGRQSLSAAEIKNKKKEEEEKETGGGGRRNASRSKMKTERHEGGAQT